MKIFAISSEQEKWDQVLGDLELTITYRGENLQLPVNAYNYGYTYRLDVTLNGQVITFEPDEEGSYRALADINTDKEIIGAIAAELEKLR
jgi:hypothetical protein